MAATDIKISQMTPATTLAGDELIPIVQNGANKSTTVNKVIEGLATEQWVTDAIADAGGKVLVVTELPAKGNPNTIYMVPNESSRANDVYDEYIWMVTTEKTGWEFLGNKHVEVDLTGYYNKTQVDKAIEDSEARSTAAIALKVDKVDGKQLSTNDYTTAEKQEVAKIANKVDKVEGKQLSTEDYTTAEKTKLSGIADNANNYTHPTTAGNKHIPAGGTPGQILVNTGDGTAEWQDNQGGGGGTIDYTGLEDIYSYGVEWDTTVADPALTRIGNPLLHKSLPIQSQYKGCVANNGVVNYYLDPNDWSKKITGEDSVLDGTDGTVRVHTPKFYGKSGTNVQDSNKKWVRISTIKMDDTWIEIPEMLIDAYRSTVDTTTSATPKAVSVVNTTAQFRGGGNRTANDTYLDTDAFRSDLGKPRTNISRANMRTYATNAGSEMLCYEYYKWIFYWAWVIEYATFNSQAAYNAELTAEGYHQGGLGDGVTTWDGTNWNNYNSYYPLTPCGYCNEFGNFTGVKDLVIPETVVSETVTVATKTFKVPRWRGFDNPFGDIWTNLDGVILERTAANQPSSVYTTTDTSAFGDDNTAKGKMTVAGTEVASDGYIKAFDLGEKGEIIPSAVGGSNTTYMCDYHYCNASSTALRTLIVGGNADTGGRAGLGCFNSNNGVGHASAHVGFRTLNKVV
nr:MAG TPA: Head fiber protein [Caudoviricetes sp.]